MSYVSRVSHNAPVPLSLLSLCPYALRFRAFAGLILRISWQSERPVGILGGETAKQHLPRAELRDGTRTSVFP